MPKPPAPPQPAAALSDSTLRQFVSFDTKVAADVRELIGSFNPKYIGIKEQLIMLLDPDVQFAMAINRAPLINMKYSIRSRDPMIKAFIECAMKKIYRQLAVGASNAMFFGHQAGEKVLQVRDLTVRVTDKETGKEQVKRFPAAWTFRRIKSIDPRTLNYLVENDEWAGLEQTDLRKGATIPSVDPGRSSVRVGRDRGWLWSFMKELTWGSLRGHGLYKPMYEPWWHKIATVLYCNRYFERKAEPPVKGRASATVRQGGKDISGIDYLVSALMALKAGGAFVLPNDVDKSNGKYLFDAELMIDDKRGDMFQSYIDSKGIQIMRGAWITDKAATAGDGTGSLAQAEEHGRHLGEMQEASQADFLDELVNPQIVDDIVRYNFGEEALRESETHLAAAGITPGQRQLNMQALTALLSAEASLAAGDKVRAVDRMDGAGIMEEMGIPMVPLAEALKIVAEMKKRAEEQAALQEEVTRHDLEDDDEPVDKKGARAAAADLARRGILDPDQILVDFQEGLARIVRDELAKQLGDVRTEDDEPEQLDTVTVPKNFPGWGGAPTNIEVHSHTHIDEGAIQSHTKVEPTSVSVKSGDTHVNQGELHAHVTLKPGEKKTAKITGPDGKETTVTVTPQEGQQ